MASVQKARLNVRAAGLTKDITIEQADFKDFKQPAEKAIMVTNPPYGERISTPDLLGTYRMIGETLKHKFKGNDAWVLSYREECFDQIGLKASVKIPLYNGSLECQLRQYQIFSGKYKEFRTDNPDKEFKPRKEEYPARNRHHREKVEYRRRDRDDRPRDDRRQSDDYRRPRRDREGL